MAASRDRDAGIGRERARAYEARLQLNAQRARRRVRDNVIGGIAGGVLLIGIVGAQTAYYTAGPGKPAPASSTTPTPTVTTPAPAVTTPVPSATPSPATTP